MRHVALQGEQQQQQRGGTVQLTGLDRPMAWTWGHWTKQDADLVPEARRTKQM